MLSSTANAEKPYVVYEGGNGPGEGKHIVLVSGDEEYRSEEALPQLGKILAQQHGFKCTVLFAIDKKTGKINPNESDNIPGLENLKTADLMIIFTRFRKLPDNQMQHIDDYLKSGRPVIGMRTSTHAFNFGGQGNFSHYGNGYKGDKKDWSDGFGRLVLGEKWISHHGHHRHESTHGLITDAGKKHPITRGLKDGDVWGPTDVYGVRLPLPGDSEPLILGQVMIRKGEYDATDALFGLRSTDDEVAGKGPKGNKNNPIMPVAWTKTYKTPGGKTGKVFTSTLGASTDLTSEGTRRMFVNAAYWCVGLDGEIPTAGAKVDIVGKFEPTAYQSKPTKFWTERAMTVSEHVYKVKPTQHEEPDQTEVQESSRSVLRETVSRFRSRRLFQLPRLFRRRCCACQ